MASLSSLPRRRPTPMAVNTLSSMCGAGSRRGICWGGIYSRRVSCSGGANTPSSSRSAISVNHLQQQQQSAADAGGAAVVIQVRTATGGAIISDGGILRRVRTETRLVTVRGLSGFGGGDEAGRYPPRKPRDGEEEEVEERGKEKKKEKERRDVKEEEEGEDAEGADGFPKRITSRAALADFQLPPDYESRFLSWKEKEQEKLMKRFRKEFEEQEANALKELTKRLKKEREEQEEREKEEGEKKEDREKRERREKEKERERERRNEENRRERVGDAKEGGAGKVENKSIPQPIPLLHPFSKFPQYQVEEHGQQAYREQRAQPKTTAPEILVPGGVQSEVLPLAAEEVTPEIVTLPAEDPEAVTLSPLKPVVGVSPLQEGGLEVVQAQDGPKPPAPEVAEKSPEVPEVLEAEETVVAPAAEADSQVIEAEPILAEVAEVVETVSAEVVESAPVEASESVTTEAAEPSITEEVKVEEMEVSNAEEVASTNVVAESSNEAADVAIVEEVETALKPTVPEETAVEVVEKPTQSVEVQAEEEAIIPVIEESRPIATAADIATSDPLVLPTVTETTPAVAHIDASAPAVLPESQPTAVTEPTPEPTVPATFEIPPSLVAELSQIQKSLADVTGVVNKLDSTMDYELNSVLIQLRLWRREVEKLASASGVAPANLFIPDVEVKDVVEKSQQELPPAPVEYKVLTISPEPPHHLLTTDLTVASGNAPLGKTGKNITEFLPTLKSPYLFLQHVPTLTNEGWELVSGAEEMLVFTRKASDKPSTTPTIAELPAGAEPIPERSSTQPEASEIQESNLSPPPPPSEDVALESAEPTEPMTVFESDSAGYTIHTLHKPTKPARPYYNTEHFRFHGHGLGGIAGDGVSFSHGVNPIDMTPREAVSASEEAEERLIDEERERLLEWESKRTEAIQSMQAALEGKSRKEAEEVVSAAAADATATATSTPSSPAVEEVAPETEKPQDKEVEEVVPETKPAEVSEVTPALTSTTTTTTTPAEADSTKSSSPPPPPSPQPASPTTEEESATPPPPPPPAAEESAPPKKKGSRTGRFFKRLGWLIIWVGGGAIVVKEVGFWSNQVAEKKRVEEALANPTLPASTSAAAGGAVGSVGSSSGERFGERWAERGDQQGRFWGGEGGAVRPGSRYSWSERERRAGGGLQGMEGVEQRFVGRRWGEEGK